MTAVDAVVDHLKGMSKQVTTPEEIAQVSKNTRVKPRRPFRGRGNNGRPDGVVCRGDGWG